VRGAGIAAWRVRSRFGIAGSLVILCAFAATQQATAGSAQKSVSAPSDPRAAGAGDVWVGVVQASYFRDYKFSSGATEHTEASVEITARANGTANGVVKHATRNEYPSSCRYLLVENGSHDGRVDPPSVSLLPNQRYRVSYPNPTVTTTIVEEKECKGATTRTGQRSTLPVYIPIEGVSADRTRVNGSLTKQYSDCAQGTTCQTIERASWDLIRLAALRDDGSGGGSGGRDRGGRGRDGGGGAPSPGDGCERRVLSGTAFDDQLTGTNHDELMLSLGGNDQVRGRGGNDCAWGSDGDDLLVGGAGSDLIGGDAGIDRISGGRGNDEIQAADGSSETVSCGVGRDAARVDRGDRVSGCESVRRS
jgi:hypothetical protein